MERDDLVDDVMHKLKAVLGDIDANVVSLDPRRDAEESGARSSVSVRVVSQNLDDGRILVSGGWQTVYAGEHTATYRVVADRGELTVSADDRTVAQVAPGQSSDVSGRTLRVTGEGVGRYRRL